MNTLMIIGTVPMTGWTILKDILLGVALFYPGYILVSVIDYYCGISKTDPETKK